MKAHPTCSSRPLRSRFLLSLALLVTLAACGGSSMGPDEASFPAMQGVWKGRWNSQACSATGTAPPASCANQTGDFGMSLTQTGGGLSGTLQACGGRATITGTITQDGILSLLTQTPAGTPAISIGTWVANVNGPFMEAVFACSVQVGATAQDALVMAVTTSNVSRTSTNPDAGF